MSEPDYDDIVMSATILEHHWDSGGLGIGGKAEVLLRVS